MKIWYFVSLLFFILSVFTLIEDKYEVTYESNVNKTESIDYLACTPLKEMEIYSNRSEIDLNLLKDKIYEYLNRSKSLIKRKYIKEYDRLVLNKIKRNNYLITRDQFCFTKIKDIDRVYFDDFDNVLKNLKHFVINWNTFYMVEMDAYIRLYDILIVLNRAYPYSNCIENYSKFQCLNKCFKGKNRLSKYWYSGNETDGIIKLNYDNNNQTLKKVEDECFEECERDDCKLVYISPIRKHDNDFKFIKASPLILPFDYWTQLIGLFVLFTNICFYQIHSQLINKINLKVKKPKHRRYVTIARHVNLILVGLGFLVSFIFNVIDFKNQQSNPIRREVAYRSIEANTFSIVFCTSVNFGRNLTLLIFEKKTNKVFNESFKGIYLDFENKRKRIDFTLSPKVIFKYNSRCFLLVPHWREISYQSLFSTSKLIVEFKSRNYNLYLIPDDQYFNSKIHSMYADYIYIKKITKSHLN